MGRPAPHTPAMLLLAAFSRHGAALEWARGRAGECWGGVALQSAVFDFRETDYYRPTMGDGLRKTFLAMERLIDPAELVELKLRANDWEEEYAQDAGLPEPRPLNLDPGYLTLGKLVLASTKDFAHRIYLGRGIFAEITLFYRRGRWEHHEWTLPDYRRVDYQAFFSQARDLLHHRLREGART